MVIIILGLIAILAIIGCIYIRKPVMRIIFGIVAVVDIILACSLGWLAYVIRYKVYPVGASASPNGAYEIIFQQLGDPEWSFGYIHARLVLKDGRDTVAKKTFDIGDDGAIASEDNWSVQWKDDSVEVIISGEEQYDVLYILNFDGTSDVEQLYTQYGKSDEEVFQTYLNELLDDSLKLSDEEVNESSNVDEYLLSDEYQSYKEEMEAIAQFIGVEAEEDIKYCITAKGCPYAVISQKVENEDRIINKELILNEAYQNEKMHEYVLEEVVVDSNGDKVENPLILDFYLVECETLNVTDEKTNQWH